MYLPLSHDSARYSHLDAAVSITFDHLSIAFGHPSSAYNLHTVLCEPLVSRLTTPLDELFTMTLVISRLASVITVITESLMYGELCKYLSRVYNHFEVMLYARFVHCPPPRLYYVARVSHQYLHPRNILISLTPESSTVDESGE